MTQYQSLFFLSVALMRVLAFYSRISQWLWFTAKTNWRVRSGHRRDHSSWPWAEPVAKWLSITWAPKMETRFSASQRRKRFRQYLLYALTKASKSPQNVLSGRFEARTHAVVNPRVIFSFAAWGCSPAETTWGELSSGNFQTLLYRRPPPNKTR